MAQQTVITSDLSGEADAFTFPFTLGEESFEIDLTSQEQEEFFSALERFTEAARRVETPVKEAKTAPAKDYDAVEVRTWAQDNGYEVPPKGRLPKLVIDEYRNARATGRL